MTTIVITIAVLAAVALIPWPTGTVCSWCGRSCDRDGNAVNREPLVANPGLCNDCSRTHTHQ